VAKVRDVFFAVLLSAVFAGTVAAQPAPSLNLKFEPQPLSSAQAPVRRDSLWNGIAIGAAAGVASVVVLDRLLCDVPDGRCDTPWLAYFTLGGIGAAAGGGIDFLIGRHTNDAKTTVRLAPVVGRASKGVRASIRF
jgi:hypothetical protein